MMATRTGYGCGRWGRQGHRWRTAHSVHSSTAPGGRSSRHTADVHSTWLGLLPLTIVFQSLLLALRRQLRPPPLGEGISVLGHAA